MILGTGEIFGDIELVNNYSTSLYSVTCIEEGSEYFTIEYNVSLIIINYYYLLN